MENLIDILKHKCKKYKPDKLAYIFLKEGTSEETTITYQELLDKSIYISANLKPLVPAKSRALLLYPQGLDFVTAFLGCLNAQIIAVPAYPPKSQQKMSRLQAIIQDCQPKLILTTSSLLDKVKEQLKDVIAQEGIQCISTDNLAETLETKEEIIKEEIIKEEIIKEEIIGDEVAFLQYTSGSTGIPKGVIISNNNIAYNSACIQKAFKLTPESVSVTWLPSFHDMGLIDGIIQPLYTGFLGVIMSPEAFLQKPIRWLEAISRYRATHSGGPNLGYELCVQKITDEEQNDLDLSSWISAYNGAEPIRRNTINNFIDKFKSSGFETNYFYTCYGMAEATLMVSGGDLDKEPVYLDLDGDELAKHEIKKVNENTKNIKQLVGCGHSWLDTEIKIVNPQTRVACDDNQIGEIWISGSSIAQGYWQKPESTREIFKAKLTNTESGEFLRTGDLGFFDNGELFITGRKKDLIIIWGKNHYPQDIEETVQNSHQALRRDSGAAFAIEQENQEKLVIVQEIERTYLKKVDINEVVTAIRTAVSVEHELQVYAIALIKPASIAKTSS